MDEYIIVGAGLSGLSAAIRFGEKGIKCNLISTQASERAQSVLAEGGINAALNTMGENDSVMEHYEDTMKGGVYLADPNAVRNLTEHAPETVRRLLSIGVPFEKEGDKVLLRPFGGQKKRRTAYAKSSTGKVIMSSLIDEARKYEAGGFIRRYAHHTVTEILLEDGICYGIRMRDRYTKENVVLYGSVILCIGGMNGLFPGMTTGTVNNTAILTAKLFAKGIKFANLEFIQYHPTTVGISGKRMLISEAARGEGGRLWIQKGNDKYYFMEEKYPTLGNLMPRDVVSAEMEAVVKDKDTDGEVYLDMTNLPKEVFKSKLSDMRSELLEYKGVDISDTPVAVKPGIHFFMGGIWVDEYHRTSIRNLYAAGECASQYHGANRLGGNSMLAAIYGGRVAADTAVSDENPEACHHTESITECANQEGLLTFPAKEAEEIRDILLSGLGIVRCGEILEETLRNLIGYREKVESEAYDKKYSDAEKEALSERLLLGEAYLRAALSRKESRGAHKRSDYPNPDEEYRKTTIVTYDGSDIHVEYEVIPAGGAYGDHT